MTPEQETRFWSYVVRGDSCWQWTGSLVHGYGQFRMGEGRRIKPHRAAYELLVGPIPDGLQIDHKCRNRACVNPQHLQAVDRFENAQNLGAGTGATGVRGVSWCKAKGAYKVAATHRGRKYHGGYFTDLAAADRAAVALRLQLMTNNLLDRGLEAA